MNYTTTTTSRIKLSQPYTSAPTNNGSTWQQFMVGAGSAAGSTAAVVSEDSMKCLRYCLSWLQYAIRNLGQQMNLLRSFLVSMATSPSQNQQQPVILATIKRDMVTTLRKVIDIITCYASTALPYQAKAAVRGTILNLPSRWASLYEDETSSTSIDVTQKQTKGQEDVALRLLAFGQESTEMLGSIHNVFDDTIQRAESWLERLRMINPMSSSQTTAVEDDDDDFYNVLLPPIRNLHISSPATT
ncbi:transcription factor Opi1-domain-containing protein [Mucor mucedo]|uniref:transcription factor Opi1-domain-containing protein n=1 Tax=Mucor mucedo TaxID=29922 RepID=UPI0022205C3A|nr:transcription factor Opi1-domain-containing protein [Mucor mucedo]KAI7876158.1 transcription factor Opi1-domain-containing protein [Mucor mucedo]